MRFSQMRLKDDLVRSLSSVGVQKFINIAELEPILRGEADK